MYKSQVDIGKAIRGYRKERSITKEQLAEQLKLSVSYVEKIEAGRVPGMKTYQKLMELLNANMVIHKETETIQEKCAEKIQKVLLSSTEAQAVFMTNMVEAMAQNIDLVT